MLLRCITVLLQQVVYIVYNIYISCLCYTWYVCIILYLMSIRTKDIWMHHVVLQYVHVFVRCFEHTAVLLWCMEGAQEAPPGCWALVCWTGSIDIEIELT